VTPVGNMSWNDEIVVDGYAPPTRFDGVVWMNAVSDDYFRTLRSQIIAGRDFGPSDRPTTPPVAIVNKAVVDKFFHGVSPIGKTYRVSAPRQLGPPITIVGVTGVAKYGTLREPPQPVVYISSLQDSTSHGNATYLL